MKEGDEVHIVGVTFFYRFDVLEEAPVYPLEAVNQTDRV